MWSVLLIRLRSNPPMKKWQDCILNQHCNLASKWRKGSFVYPFELSILSGYYTEPLKEVPPALLHSFSEKTRRGVKSGGNRMEKI